MKKWEEEVYFSINDEKYDFIEGFISKIERDEYEYEGKKIPLVKIIIEDGKEEIVFSVSFNQISRSILNSLANQKELGKINIKVYSYIKNDRLTKGATVTNNWEKCNWALSVDEQKALSELIIDKKGEVIKVDRDALDEKLMQLVKNVKFSGHKDVFDLMTESKMSDDDNLDLPF